MARLCTVRFLSAVRAVAAHCKHPFALRPGLSRETVTRTKEITNDEAKESVPLLLSYRRQEVRRGQEQRQFPPSARLSAPGPPSSSHSRTSSSDTALTASSPSSGGASLPTRGG